MSRILVVDDDDQLRRALRINLAARQYEVLTAADGASALQVAGRTPPDLAIVDLGLPDLDGVDVVRGLRGWTSIPIIVLSARDAVFAPFQRLGDHTGDGLGLGLAIARGFTEAQGGTLRPDDTPGGGLTMTITLPAVRP